MTTHLRSFAAAITGSVTSSPVFRTFLEDYDTDNDHLAGPPISMLVGALVTGFFLLLTLIPAGIFIYQHHWRLRHEPSLQISIIRSRIIPIISLIPVFACSSYLSVVFPDIGFYIHPVRLVTTAYCIYAFLRFLLEILGGDKRAFIALRDQPARPLYNAFPFLCCIPMGPKPFTQTTLTVAKSLLYQSVVLLPLTAAAEMVIYWSEEQVAMPVLELTNLVSVLLCCYGLGIFYRACKDILYAHKPFVKFFTINFMLLLLVTQKLFFSLLVYSGAIAQREGIAKTVQIEGWHAFCLVFETLIMQLMMQKTFPGPEFDNGISLTDDPTKPKRETTLDSLDDLPSAASKNKRAPRKGGVIDGEDEDDEDEDDRKVTISINSKGRGRPTPTAAASASLSKTPKASPRMKEQHAPSAAMPKPSFFSRIIKSPVAALPEALPDPVNDIALKGERDSFNKWKKERELEEQKLRSREEAVEKKASEEDERRKKRSESHARTRSAVPNSALLSKVFNVPEKKEEAPEDKKGKKKGLFGKKSKDNEEDGGSSKKGGAGKALNKLLGKEEKPKEKLNFVQKAKKKYVKAVDTANMVLKVAEGL